jgi:hypothetical protein
LNANCRKCNKDPNDTKENQKSASSNSLGSSLLNAPVINNTILPSEDPRRNKFHSPLDITGNNVAKKFFGSYSNQQPFISDGIYPPAHTELLHEVNALHSKNIIMQIIGYVFFWCVTNTANIIDPPDAFIGQR